jgi:hypothetical protein
MRSTKAHWMALGLPFRELSPEQRRDPGYLTQYPFVKDPLGVQCWAGLVMMTHSSQSGGKGEAARQTCPWLSEWSEQDMGLGRAHQS